MFLKIYLMKIKHIFLFLFLVSIVSCGKEEPTLEIGTFVEFSVPAGLSTIESHYFIRENVPILYDSQLSASGIDESNVEMFVAGAATLIPGSGRDFDLGFIRGVNVFLVEENGKRNELFYLDLVPIGDKTEIRLFNSIVDLQDKIVNDRGTIETKLEFNTPPPTTYDFRLNMSFAVFAGE